jgi:radical SAM protein with 4Fe4S-binding SPASM domain
MNRTQEQILNDENALMHYIEESHKDMCDNCDLYPECHGCVY